MNRISPWTLLVLVIGCAHALPPYETLAAGDGDLVLRVPVGWHVRPAVQGMHGVSYAWESGDRCGGFIRYTSDYQYGMVIQTPRFEVDMTTVCGTRVAWRAWTASSADCGTMHYRVALFGDVYQALSVGTATSKAMSEVLALLEASRCRP